jgi:hypothetical protein
MYQTQLDVLDMYYSFNNKESFQWGHRDGVALFIYLESKVMHLLSSSWHVIPIDIGYFGGR